MFTVLNDTCKYAWDYTEFGKCSKECGTGIAERYAQCRCKAGELYFSDTVLCGEQPALNTTCNTFPCDRTLAVPVLSCVLNVCSCSRMRSVRRVRDHVLGTRPLPKYLLDIHVRLAMPMRLAVLR